RTLINAAGLFAQRVAHSIAGVPPDSIPASYLAKGHYFTLSGRSPFRHLIYPVPEPGGLGVHVTLDMAGAARFGPDVSWIDELDYFFEESRAQSFCQTSRAYYSELIYYTLAPVYTRVRPKSAAAGSPAVVFVVQGPEIHELPVVNLFGIE